MDDEGIRVNWRAAIVPLSGERVVHGRLGRLSRKRAIVVTDHNLKAGNRCNFALMLPKNSPAAPGHFIEGRGVVSSTVLCSMQFHSTVEFQEFLGGGEALLEDRIREYGQMWGKPL
ncbi:MAG TPA: hypothetical protein VFP33_13375 [Gallionella sp.]|nr:hypothetical protein [Gallionella sp.]